MTLATVRHIFSQPSGLRALEGHRDKVAGLGLLRRCERNLFILITWTTQHFKGLGDF